MIGGVGTEQLVLSVIITCQQKKRVTRRDLDAIELLELDYCAPPRVLELPVGHMGCAALHKQKATEQCIAVSDL